VGINIKKMSLLTENKTVGILTILSGIIALACMVFSAMAVDYHFEVFNNPSLMLSLPKVNAELSKWSMICDMIGYYMLLLPIIYYFNDWLKSKTVWYQLITFSGLAYVLIGAIGASILAVVYPTAINSFQGASLEMQKIIKANFEFANNIVYAGMWNLLEMFFVGIWWLFIGIFLFKSSRKFIGLVSIILAVVSFLDSLSGMINNASLHEISLNIYLYLSIIWAIWMGIQIYRKPL
jgi:hypothetical protein